MKKYICVKQHDIKDCGAACLSTISKTYDLKLQMFKIREIAGTDSYGTSVFGLVKAAEQLGFTAKAIKGTRENLLTQFPLPAIANVLTEDNIQHYVVIHKINEKKVIICDPAKGLRKLSFDDFAGMWTGYLVILKPSYNFKKRNETKGSFTRFFKMLTPQKGLLINVFLMSVVLTIFGIIGSFYFKFLMDEIIPYGLEKTLHIVSLAFVGLYLLNVILGAFRSHLLMYLSIRLDIPLMLGYYKHVTKLPLNFFSSRQIGEITSRFQDAGIIKDVVSGAALTIMLDTIMVIIGGIILYTINPTMFLISVIIAVLYAVLVYAFIKPFKRIQRRSMEQGAKVSSQLIESIHGVETIKAYNAEDSASLETESRYIKSVLIGKKGGILGNVQGSMIGAVEAIGGLFILWYGALMVIRGEITLGQLLTFNALLAYFLSPLKNLIGLQQQIQSAVVASERLSEIIDLELEYGPDEKKKYKPEIIKGNIELKDIDFRYGSRRLVLNKLSLSIKKGESIALVGESGSGKTTLAKLILHLYKAEKGEIKIDDMDLESINKECLRNHIGYVSQDVFLFSGSVEDNLFLGQDSVNYSEMKQVCELLKIDEFVQALPKKYQSPLIEGGSNLSGGQRQRLAIARALLKQPSIIILDEATSNLDAKTEEAITEVLFNQYKDLTKIIIAHRLSTIRKADKIAVMDQGEIKEFGSHKELMNQKGFYYSLWVSQVGESEVVNHAK
ncbi:peptidase domain-containing ABC transporter [Mycoplasmatota bacterium]|nr:peptidase domain-containing ABC transporter [Mycoplasmatota bacterium]